MKIHVITPCSRPQNLQKVYKSINFPCNWWIIFDSESFTFQDFKPKEGIDINYGAIKGGEAGKMQVNWALDHIKEGWVYVLDDDNLMHPDFHKFIETFEKCEASGFQGIIFAQQLENDPVRYVKPGEVKVCKIDQAQFLINRSMIGEKRYYQDYNGDGIFIEQLYAENPGKFIITHEILSYYNRITWKKSKNLKKQLQN